MNQLVLALAVFSIGVLAALPIALMKLDAGQVRRLSRIMVTTGILGGLLLLFSGAASAQEPESLPRERFTITAVTGVRTLTESSGFGNGEPNEISFTGNTGEANGWFWVTKNAFVKGAIQSASLSPNRAFFSSNSSSSEKVRFNRQQVLLGVGFPYGSIGVGFDRLVVNHEYSDVFLYSSSYTSLETAMFGPMVELNLGKNFGAFRIGGEFQYSPHLMGQDYLIAGRTGSSPDIQQTIPGINWHSVGVSVKAELAIYKGFGLAMDWNYHKVSTTDEKTFPHSEFNRALKTQAFVGGGYYRFTK